MNEADRRPARPTLLAAAAATLLAACATAGPTAPDPRAQVTPPPAAPTAATSPADAASAPRAAAPTAATPPRPGVLPPFAETTRDAKRTAGYLPVWTRDDRTWLEIPAELIDKPLFFGASLASGLGERGFFPGLMGREQVVTFKRVGNAVQLVARNLYARAPDGTPLGRAVGESYSDSLLASAPLAAAPHPQHKGLLVDAFALLGGDLSGLQTALEGSYRLAYALDRGNSSIERAATRDSGTAFTLRAHFSVPKLPALPVQAPGAPPPNPAALPNPPRGVPDPRSLFINVTYNFAPLPAQPMRTRQADQRVGYFTSSFIDFGNDRQEGRRTHIIERWRLEKKDPQAAVSEPKEPIRVVMDRNIPEKWREPLRAGILEWNKAFEKAGIRNAIAVEQQASDADWTSFEGTRMLAVRWFATDGPGATAVGPSQSDPRTGEILRAAAIIPENWVRIFRSRASDTEPRLSTTTMAGGDFAKRYMQCTYADEALEQTQFAMDLLDARGALNPEGPEAERFIAQSLKDVTMHEVGHALGLRHNFRSSTTVTPAQLRDPAYTAQNGVSNSVMDYNALNIPLDNERVADYHMVTLGAYDYWAIEYGYRELAPQDETRELARIAGQSDRDPALVYATDDDVVGTDPLVNQRDLGTDPLVFAQRQVTLSHELWRRTQARPLADGDDLTVYRRNLQRGFANLSLAVPLATKYVGGTFTSRTLAGSGQALWVPVPADKQRAALDLVVGELFNSANFRFDPKFMSRLGIDQFERSRGTVGDFSLGTTVAGLQRSALDSLMSEGLAQRLADAESKVSDTRTLLSYAEVQERLQRSIWSELSSKRGGEIDSLRRNLQREHLRRLAGGLLRASSTAAADVRAVHRQGALQLQTALKSALATSGWSPTARAHLDDSLATLAEALKATLSKQGV